MERLDAEFDVFASSEPLSLERSKGDASESALLVGLLFKDKMEDCASFLAFTSPSIFFSFLVTLVGFVSLSCGSPARREERTVRTVFFPFCFSFFSEGLRREPRSEEEDEAGTGFAPLAAGEGTAPSTAAIQSPLLVVVEAIRCALWRWVTAVPPSRVDAAPATAVGVDCALLACGGAPPSPPAPP